MGAGGAGGWGGWGLGGLGAGGWGWGGKPYRYLGGYQDNQDDQEPSCYPITMATTVHPETQYLDLIRHILDRGSREEGRNGAVYTSFGHSMRFSLKDGVWPLLTTKKVAWKACFHELMWFLGGKTDNRLLQAQGVHIWDANASRSFLDGRGLSHRSEGDLGPIYGFQWRHWNAPYDTCDDNYVGEGVDQIQYIIDALRGGGGGGAGGAGGAGGGEGRSSRRLLVSAWNPGQLDEMALPPCHVLMQFHVRENRYLSCALYQRSGDVGLGVPFNIASYSMLTHLMAHHCGLEADEFVYFLGNTHIYESHVEVLREQMGRDPLEFPRVRIGGEGSGGGGSRVRDRIEDYELSDIEWVRPYESHGVVKMAMVA